MRLSFSSTLFLLCWIAACTPERSDPALALPVSSGIHFLWANGQQPVPVGLPVLDAEVRRLPALLPARDSLDTTFTYAAFAHNLRPGELVAGLAVPLPAIRRPDRRSPTVDYRGVTIHRLDSTEYRYAEHRGLALIGQEAVVLQEMIDQLDRTGTPETISLANINQSLLRIDPAELSALLSSQLAPGGRDRLAQWAEQWRALEISFQPGGLAEIRLRPSANEPAEVIIAGCQEIVPGGLSQYALLPVPTGLSTSPQGNDNWSTYFSPWLSGTYARLTTAEGTAVAFCPRDAELMADLIDRLESDFPSADRIQYPNGTIWQTTAPGLLDRLFSNESGPAAWILRTATATYLAPSRSVLERILDLQLLSGPAPILLQLKESTRPPALVLQLDRATWTDDVKAVLPTWNPPPWAQELTGVWRGDNDHSPQYLVLTQLEAAVARQPYGPANSPVQVAWRWEAPDDIERILPVPGRADCAIYLQNGTLLVLDENRNERLNIRLGTTPNSPIYRLPPGSDRPERWLFSTPTAVFLVDGTGTAAEGFPYRPMGGLAAGVLLDDLDMATNPAYYLPLRTGRIEAYSLRGTPLVNWRVPSGFAVAAPLLALHSDTSTYLAAQDSLSRIRVYDRQGAVYLAFDSLPSPFISPVRGQLNKGAGVGRLAALELDGRIRVMSLAGGHFPLPVTTQAGTPRQFIFDQLWGDVRHDYLVTRDDAVALYAYSDNDFARRWEARFPRGVERIFTLPSLQMIGGLDRNRGLIYLLRGADGSTVEANGLAGRLPGQELLTKPGESLVLTAYRNVLYAYRIATGRH